MIHVRITGMTTNIFVSSTTTLQVLKPKILREQLDQVRIDLEKAKREADYEL
jgi:hypothetical protein